MYAKKGSTLLEVLLSFAILATTGLLLLNFLYRSPISERVWVNDYGAELSRVAIFKSIDSLSDFSDSLVIFSYNDLNNGHWESLVSIKKDASEICYAAISIRNRVDTTKLLHYCRYAKDSF